VGPRAGLHVAPNRKIPASIGNVIPVAQFVIVTLLTELSWLTKPNYTKIKNDVFGRKRSRPDSATIPTLNDKELTKWKKKKKKKTSGQPVWRDRYEPSTSRI